MAVETGNVGLQRAGITLWLVEYLNDAGILTGLVTAHHSAGWDNDPQDPSSKYHLHSVVHPQQVAGFMGGIRRANEIMDVPYAITSNADDPSFCELQADIVRKLVLDIDRSRPEIEVDLDGVKGVWGIITVTNPFIGALTLNRQASPNETQQTDSFVIKVNRIS